MAHLSGNSNDLKQKKGASTTEGQSTRYEQVPA
jgi:hypothetical protein